MRTSGTIGIAVAVVLVAAQADALAKKSRARVRKEAKVAAPAPAPEPRLLSDTLPMDDLVIAPPSGTPATTAPATAKREVAALGADRAGYDLTRRARDVARPSGEDVLRMDAATLPQAKITPVVRAGLAQLQFCYERAASGDPDATGEVTLRFTISPKGKVSGITTAAGGTDAAELEGCMKRHVARWKFPASDAPTEVDYPLVFDLAGAPR
jgi:outer membrane biosynthesis protein TonB